MKKCVDCKDYFAAGEAFEEQGQWVCVVCLSSRPKVEAPKVEQAQPTAAQPVREDQEVRSCRVRAMRAAFKAAQAMGCNTQDAEMMRGAIAKYFGRPCLSRRDLSAGQWAEFQAGLELGVISF